MEESAVAGRKWPLALLVACPACAGGVFLAIGTALGATAFALKGALLFAGLTIVVGLWARNIWRRRGEDSCTTASSPVLAKAAETPQPPETQD